MSPYGQTSDNEHERNQQLYVMQPVEGKKLTGSDAAKHRKLSLQQVRRLVQLPGY
jgi:hypothetical protein